MHSSSSGFRWSLASFKRWGAGVALALSVGGLISCGGGSGGSSSVDAVPSISTRMAAIYQNVAPPTVPQPDATPTTQLDAVRLANQASFGPNETLVNDILTAGPKKWIADQMQLARSAYVSGGDDGIHTTTNKTNFCDQPAHAASNCSSLYFSTQPLLWDFYRNAVNQPDQLRQRVAFALQQILVVSGVDINSTYGMRNYHNELLKGAFGNYRDILKKVILSPVMGDYLNNVNNPASAPNENFARELLQLFSIGPCTLNADGSLMGGVCTPTYDNNMVRQYAYALSGWTYPAGGISPWGKCWPDGVNCRYHNGDMVPVPSLHDTAQRSLLSGSTVAANASAYDAVNTVLDSLMKHPNMAPFIGKQLIQHFVTSNPSAAYVSRVAQAFRDGQYQGFGAGTTGDLAATVAAVLLDPEARNENPPPDFGKLREPALLMAGALRAFHGTTDGGPLGWWWGESMQQHVFMPPTVFSYFPPDYPVPIAGQSLVGPAFGILNANTGMARLNFLNDAVWNERTTVTTDAPVDIQAPTRMHLEALRDQLIAYRGLTQTEKDNALYAMIDSLSMTLLGQKLPSKTRDSILNAANANSWANDGNEMYRVRAVAFLILASPWYQVMH